MKRVSPHLPIHRCSRSQVSVRRFPLVYSDVTPDIIGYVFAVDGKINSGDSTPRTCRSAKCGRSCWRPAPSRRSPTAALPRPPPLRSRPSGPSLIPREEGRASVTRARTPLQLALVKPLARMQLLRIRSAKPSACALIAWSSMPRVPPSCQFRPRVALMS
jgi:hypothetical protein